MNFLILDVGTSSMRGILFREDGTMLHTVQKEYQVITLEHGWVEQNPLDFKDSMTQIVKQSAEFAAQEEEKIDVIALTSQRGAAVPGHGGASQGDLPALRLPGQSGIFRREDEVDAPEPAGSL